MHLQNHISKRGKKKKYVEENGKDQHSMNTQVYGVLTVPGWNYPLLLLMLFTSCVNVSGIPLSGQHCSVTFPCCSFSGPLLHNDSYSLSTVYLCFCDYKCQIANQTQERQLESWQWPAGRSAISVEIWGALHFCFLELDLLKKMWVEISAHCYVVVRALLWPSISLWFLLKCSKDAIDWILLSVLFRGLLFPSWKLEVSAHGVIGTFWSVRVCEEDYLIVISLSCRLTVMPVTSERPGLETLRKPSIT